MFFALHHCVILNTIYFSQFILHCKMFICWLVFYTQTCMIVILFVFSSSFFSVSFASLGRPVFYLHFPYFHQYDIPSSPIHACFDLWPM